MKLIYQMAILLLSLLVLPGLAGCGVISMPTATPTPHQALTEIAQARETLRAQVVQAAPTLTAFYQSEKAQATPVPTKGAQSLPLITVLPSSTLTPQSVIAATEMPAQGSLQPGLQAGVLVTPQMIKPPSGTQLPSPTPVAQLDTVLFQDDFSGKRGWYTTDSDRYRLVFDQGGYRILVMTKNNPIWSVRTKPFSDSRLEVDATQLHGPTDGYYGLVCRFIDTDHYYLMVVSRDGTFGIGKVKDKELRYLAYTSQYNKLIKPAGNRLRADCVGETLTLSVDGQKVLETVDDEFKSGATGVVVGNRTTSGTDVLFDNYIVLKP
jgi:hypothetical protein